MNSEIIEDAAQIDAIERDCHELRDGLFTVVAQQRLIEMHLCVVGENNDTYYIVTTSTVADDNDGICNSSETAGKKSLYDIFSENRERVAYTSHDDAIAVYCEYIYTHTHMKDN